MSPGFEDWLKEKHPEIDGEERAKLVKEEANLTDETIKSFDFLRKMPTRKALEVFAALMAGQMDKLSYRNQLLHAEYFNDVRRELVSPRQLIDIIADGYVRDRGLSREEAEEKAKKELSKPPVSDKDDPSRPLH